MLIELTKPNQSLKYILFCAVEDIFLLLWHVGIIDLWKVVNAGLKYFWNTI